MKKKEKLPETLHGSLTTSSKAPAQVSMCVKVCAHSFLCAYKKRQGEATSDNQKGERERRGGDIKKPQQRSREREKDREIK